MGRETPEDIPHPLVFAISGMYNIFYYGAFIVLLHFVARSGLGSSAWPLQLLGIAPVTVFLYHWLVPQHGLVQFIGVPMLGQLRWPDRRTILRMLIAAGTLLVARAILLLALFTEVFAAWTAFWYERGMLSGDPALGGDTLATAEHFYLWNLADAFPSLKVPETLQWHLGPSFTDWRSGALLLVYKIVVILPLIYGFVAVLRRVWDEFGRSRQQTVPD